MRIKSYDDLEKTGIPVREILKLIEKEEQDRVLREYQWALSLWAEHAADTRGRVIVTLDGRDTAGKGSNIKRVVEQLNPTRFNTSAFGIPTPEEKQWDNWFQRYEKFFPEEGKIRFFDRSWYNRTSVEAAMGFCTEEEYRWFMENVWEFEQERIINPWYSFLKIYLSIKKRTQKERLERRKSERKRWKSSPIDAQAQEKWDYYTLAKQKILEMTDSNHSPWTVIDSNEKFLSAVEIIKMIISTSEEIKKNVENDLSLDLSPNKKVRRTATQELQRMGKAWEIPTKHNKFQFDTSRVNSTCLRILKQS